MLIGGRSEMDGIRTGAFFRIAELGVEKWPGVVQNCVVLFNVDFFGRYAWNTE